MDHSSCANEYSSSAVLMNIPNSKVCLKEEWSIHVRLISTRVDKTVYQHRKLMFYIFQILHFSKTHTKEIAKISL